MLRRIRFDETGTEAGAPPGPFGGAGTNVTWNSIGGAPASVPLGTIIFQAFEVAVSNERTEAGAPPRSSEGSNKPARPPALQVRSSWVRANRIIIAGNIGGPAASPAC